jgi:DNA-binding CsgD family transcriptional regulator
VVTEHDLSTDDERKRLVHYNELYLRHGFPGFAMVGFQVDGQLWTLPMLRATSQGHFTKEEAQRLAGLQVHFARMVRLADNLAMRQAEGQLNMLQKLGSAAILLDWQGLALQVNAQADALLGPDLMLTHRRLRAADPRSNLELQLLLDQLRALPSMTLDVPFRRVLVRRRDAGPLVIEALPVSGLTASVFQRAKVLLVITDMERRAQPPEEMLRQAFNLTGAEARLAKLLAGGQNLKDAAEHLHIARSTARVQLKSIFAKTGTNRQAELVARLGNMRR